MPEKYLFHGRFNIIASLNVQTISLLEANIIVNLLLGTDKIMLQRYMILLATMKGHAVGSSRNLHTVG